VRQRLASREPLELLAEVSGLVAALDPRNRNPFEQNEDRGDGPPELAELARTFAEVDRTETSALLAAIAELAPDELTRSRCRRALATRRYSLPLWLTRLGDTEITRCLEMVHVLGDGDDLIVGVRLADGHELAVIVYVDHNLGTVAKDGFVIPGPVDELVRSMQAGVDELADNEWRELDPADTRARITETVEHGAMMFPPLESDTWPLCRPLVEWVARRLPAGGVGYEHPEWDDADTAAVAAAFFASPFGAPLDDQDHRQLFDSLIWFATGYGPGDPLRWSPVSVEMLLVDWIPRKIVAPAAYLAKAPDLVRALVHYAHDVRHIRAELTAETLAAVDAEEPEYQRVIRSPRPQGPMALLAQIGVVDPNGPWDELDDDEEDELFDIATAMVEHLSRAVGGPAALATLSVASLPDEPFGWEGVPDDVRAIVGEVLLLCDRCCDELLDVEYRTACRRLLARVVNGDPGIFRRRGRADTAAAAICWIVGKANDLFAGGALHAKDLLGHFGLASGSVSQRAATLLKAAGIGPYAGYFRPIEVVLGSPEMLVATQRRRYVELRDRYGGGASSGELA
jgi:hypothetical protein